MVGDYPEKLADFKGHDSADSLADIMKYIVLWIRGHVYMPVRFLVGKTGETKKDFDRFFGYGTSSVQIYQGRKIIWQYAHAIPKTGHL